MEHTRNNLFILYESKHERVTKRTEIFDPISPVAVAKILMQKWIQRIGWNKS